MKKLLFTLLLLPLICLSQSPCDEDVCVVQFNAGWNGANDVEWVENLKDCEIQYIDIATDTDAQAKFEIVVVPTIIVFNGEEVERFQANIMMQIDATRKDIQSVVDEIIYSDF